MTKRASHNATATQAAFDFYRPHNRADTWYTGELVDPVTGEVYVPPSMTKQSFVEQCDINNIIKSFSKTGMLNHVNRQAALGSYQDLPDSFDFQEALHTVKRAEQSFATLPSRLRARFENNPRLFVAFLQDPANQAEAIELGLMTAPPAPEPPLTPEISPPDNK